MLKRIRSINSLLFVYYNLQVSNQCLLPSALSKISLRYGLWWSHIWKEEEEGSLFNLVLEVEFKRRLTRSNFASIIKKFFISLVCSLSNHTVLIWIFGFLSRQLRARLHDVTGTVSSRVRGVITWSRFPNKEAPHAPHTLVPTSAPGTYEGHSTHKQSCAEDWTPILSVLGFHMAKCINILDILRLFFRYSIKHII